MKKLIPALALLVVSAILMGTSTFAWFSLNNRVTVTGMQVSTKIGDNLLIAADELDSTAKKADNLFANGLNYAVGGILEPVSTVNGTSYFYTKTSNVKADGDAITDTYVAYNEAGTIPDGGTARTRGTEAHKGTAFDSAFNVDHSNTVGTDTNVYYGYVDYVFQLKATNTADTETALKLTKLNLLYDDAVAGDAKQVKAFRVALFVERFATDGNPSSGVGALKSILSYSGSTYFDNASKTYVMQNSKAGTDEGSGVYSYTATCDGQSDDTIYGKGTTVAAVDKWYSNVACTDNYDITKFVTKVAGSENGTYKVAAPTAVNSTSTLGTVEKLNTAAKLDDVPQNSTYFYKVVVRMWLEGEDSTCNNETYLTLTKNWTLDLAVELSNSAESGHTAVTNIGSSTNVTATGGSTSATVTINDSFLSSAAIVKTYQWYLDDGTLIEGATEATYEPDPHAVKNVYCIVTANGSQYRTKVVSTTAT